MPQTTQSPRRQRTYVCAILLDGSSPINRRFQRVNPDYVQGNPKVVIEHLKVNPQTAYANDNFEESSNRIVREHAVSILDEYSTHHTKRWGVISSIDRTTKQLRSEGWAVLNSNPPKKSSVYVVELDKAVGEIARVRRINPEADPSLEHLYVGQTGLDPQERFERHMRGHQASPDVRRFGLHLNMTFLRRDNPMTELESLREENSLASHLRSRGHTVVGGH
jgi:hypothetical protein